MTAGCRCSSVTAIQAATNGTKTDEEVSGESSVELRTIYISLLHLAVSGDSSLGNSREDSIYNI